MTKKEQSTAEQSGVKNSGALPADQIELINSYGPYTHAVWSSGDLQIGDEGQLRGRGKFLVERIRECLLSHFTLDEIKTFSILDVGCYDGWILHQLSDLPFARMVGVEPREKNIVKGKKIREILHISSRVEFEKGDIDSLGRESFDIVLCIGLLHHLESLPEAMRRLKAVCRRMLFIESICLSPRYITSQLKKEIEMKDVIYRYKDQTCGLTGQKWESSYYDGSTTQLSVVSIPSVETLLMYLERYGFGGVEMVADPQSYRSSVWGSKRHVYAVCLCALAAREKAKVFSEEWAWVRDYEEGLAATVLPRRYIEPLYQVFCLNGTPRKMRSLFALAVWLYLAGPRALSGLLAKLIKGWLKKDPAREIVLNLKYNPRDKLCLEMGKILYDEKNDEGAVAVLRQITGKVNADWRSVYWAFALLAQAYERLGKAAESERYRALCQNCNSVFYHIFFGGTRRGETAVLSVEGEAR